MLGLAVILGAGLLQTHALAQDTSLEPDLRGALSAMLDNRAQTTLNIARKGLHQQPDFRSLNLLYADLLAALAHQKPLMAYTRAQNTERLKGLKEEILARFTYIPPQRDQKLQNILKLSRLHKYALALDAEKSRLYLLENVNGKPVPRADFYVSIGTQGMGKEYNGDNKTPTGIYRITSFLTDKQLAELYGDGAYPINYPNALDRLQRRSGYGIWLHGTPRDLASRPPEDSRGCIIVDNETIKQLHAYIEIGRTPLLLSKKLAWLTPAQWQVQQDQLVQQVFQWKEDWESMDVEKYLTHYSPKYRTEQLSYTKMLRQTRNNAKKKTRIHVRLRNLDLFIDPQNPKLAKAVFDQDYQSNNYNVKYRKQQIWENTGNTWKIIYEGKV